MRSSTTAIALVVERDGKRVRFFTRNGHLRTDRYSLIVEVALRNRSSLFAIDGEAVQLGGDGVSDCNGLHSLRHDDEVQLYASDVMELDGDDLRKLPLTMRKTNPARLLARRRDGIFIAPARSALTCFGKPANSVLRAWCQNAGTATIGPAARQAGSRSRTGRRIRRWRWSRKRFRERRAPART
jgi:ATP-dependent DNA ligase